MLMDGIYVPLTAPFYRDGASYWKKLEHNTGRYSLTPAAGLVALTGEGEALSDAEMLETLTCVSASAAPEKVLVARIAKESVRGALWLAEAAAKAGFDAVLLRAPRGLSAAELRVFLAAVADGSELPVLLSSAADGLPVETIAEFAQHRNALGLFDAGLTVERYHEIVAATAAVKREVSVTTVFAPVTRRMKAPVSEGRGDVCLGGVVVGRSGCCGCATEAGDQDAHQERWFPSDGGRPRRGVGGVAGGRCCGSDADAGSVRSARML